MGVTESPGRTAHPPEGDPGTRGASSAVVLVLAVAAG